MFTQDVFFFCIAIKIYFNKCYDVNKVFAIFNFNFPLFLTIVFRIETAVNLSHCNFQVSGNMKCLAFNYLALHLIWKNNSKVIVAGNISFVECRKSLFLKNNVIIKTCPVLVVYLVSVN